MKKDGKKGQRRTTRHGALPFQYRGGWRIQWIDIDGRRKSMTFAVGEYDEAVAELARIKGERQAMKDGRLPRKKEAPTLAKFAEEYWTPNRLEKQSAKDEKSILKKHLVPKFGNYRLDQITTPMVAKFKGELVATGLGTSSIIHILGLLGSMLRYAMDDLDFLYRLPKIEKPRENSTSYVYIRTQKEIANFLAEAKKMDHEKAEENRKKKLKVPVEPCAFELFATAIYTGMRAGELFGLRWTDVDIKKRLITVQRSFDHPTKTGAIRHIPILDPLLPVLKKWKLRDPHEYVFPSDTGTMNTPSPRVVKFTFHEALTKAKLQNMRFHDLRHTFASHWVLNGGDMYRLQKILGHSSQEMVQRYAHLAPGAFDSVRDLFGKRIPKVKKAPVISLEKKRKSLRGK